MQVLDLLVSPTCYNSVRNRSVLTLSSAIGKVLGVGKGLESMLSLRKELDDVNVIEKEQLYRAGIAD